MANLAGFNADEIPEQQEFGAIPPGSYVVIATASEFKPTKAGTGQYLEFCFEVIDGEFKGRKLWDRMNLQNPNQTAVDIAQRALGALCRAVNLPKPADSSELHNKPLRITVDVEIDDRKRESNTIKKYEAATPGTAAPAAGYTPPAARPAAAAAATPPWKK